MRKAFSIAALTVVLALVGVETGRASPREVLAVLSSESSYYRQAWTGFQEIMGDRTETVTLQSDKPRIPPEVKVVVAFGAKAALQDYPKSVTLVYCMAPGTLLPMDLRVKRSLKVEMLPRPGFVLSKIKELQPGLKRLAVFWTSAAMNDYVKELQKAAPSFGVEVEAAQSATPDDLPDSLRGLKTKPDAFWIPPDPTLITPTNFTLLKDYAWSNRVPFYVPTDGLLEKGATASIACSLKEIGRITASAVMQLAATSDGKADRIYPEEIQVTVSRLSAKNTGLQLAETAPKGTTILR